MAANSALVAALHSFAHNDNNHGKRNGYNQHMNLKVETEREEDGRWIAEVPELPGVLAYGSTRERAVAHAEALALRVIAERLENEEDVPDMANLFLITT